MYLPRSWKDSKFHIAALLLLILIVVEGYSPTARAAFSSPAAAEAVTRTEDKGDHLFNASNYRDSAQEYARAMKILGLDIERITQLKPGTLSKLQDPLQTAILMRKWARATQLDFEAEFDRGRQPPIEPFFQALFAVSSAVNVFEGLRENIAIEEESVAHNIAEELRQGYDIQIEICYVLFGAQDRECLIFCV